MTSTLVPSSRAGTGVRPSWEAVHQSPVQETGGQRELGAGLSLAARSLGVLCLYP